MKWKSNYFNSFISPKKKRNENDKEKYAWETERMKEKVQESNNREVKESGGKQLDIEDVEKEREWMNKSWISGRLAPKTKSIF